MGTTASGTASAGPAGRTARRVPGRRPEGGGAGSAHVRPERSSGALREARHSTDSSGFDLAWNGLTAGFRRRPLRGRRGADARPGPSTFFVDTVPVLRPANQGV